MIKNTKSYDPNALINSTKFRDFVENFESEIIRGISTLSIISIINNHKEEGVYGYQLMKDLKKKTKNMLMLEEGTLYPILRKLKKEGILKNERKLVGGRARNYYFITSEGIKTYHHLLGFFAKLVESLGPLLNLEVNIKEERYFYCPNCSNRISRNKIDKKLCPICGYDIN
ncbi:MAG: PadR family transcriptional regulator [Candidatus Lokiarchaeota archaeon]